MRRWWLAGAACTLVLAGAPAIAGSQALAATAQSALVHLTGAPAGAARSGPSPYCSASNTR